MARLGTQEAMREAVIAAVVGYNHMVQKHYSLPDIASIGSTELRVSEQVRPRRSATLAGIRDSIMRDDGRIVARVWQKRRLEFMGATLEVWEKDPREQDY